MNPFYLILLFFCILIASIGITYCLYHLALKNDLLDIPNQRSSHTVPTPKGGGISIVVLLIITTGILFYFQMISREIMFSVITGLLIISIIGLIDDYKNLPIPIRLTGYTFGAIMALYFIGGVSSLFETDYDFFKCCDINISRFSDIGPFLAILYMLWLTNLYNFMDGVDGFAAIQTICVSLFCSFLFYFSGNYGFAVIMFCLVSATSGFLYWNWSPAKIFMGDVGSCSIGFFFGLFSIYTAKEGIVPISIWLILLAPFIGDATFTLIKRLINKEKWYEAHNTHAFQNLLQLGLSHRQLTLGLLLTNLLFIWPLAIFVQINQNYDLYIVLLAYILVWIVWFIAHLKNNQSTESST
jgi:Fuc2NAc and GlcNAc transferase